jgi:hypothetical protein
MTEEAFRQLALSFPEAAESAHMQHPDFCARKKIFATLQYPSAEWAMVKLTPEQQRTLVESDPAVFVPVKGGWGLKGATNVRLKAATKDVVHHALRLAWANVAPKSLV